MNAEVPKKVRVFGRVYSLIPVLKLLDDDGAELLGQCDNEKLTIKFLQGQHPTTLKDTLIHEVLHAIWYSMNLMVDPMGDIEEQAVTGLARGITGVLADNPHFAAYVVQQEVL